MGQSTFSAYRQPFGERERAMYRERERLGHKRESALNVHYKVHLVGRTK